jgi:hypothetical protein
MRFVTLALVAVLAPASARGDCISQDKANAAVAAATTRNEASYQAALAKKKLAPATLHELRWRQGATPPPRVIEASTRAVNCEHQALEFVQTADHKLYKVARQPHAKTTQTLAVCTCAVPHFACGGANMGDEGYGYELPAGATFAGEMAIAFDADGVVVTNRTDCPPIAPPPAAAR